MSLVLPRPIQHCIVVLADGRLGRVVEARADDPEDRTRVVAAGATTESMIRTADLRSGYTAGHTVEHISITDSRNSRGVGTVIDVRTIASRQQVLVQFASSGETCWVSYETLRVVMPVEARMTAGNVGQHADHAERFRLRTLAQALENWDNNTGAFGRLDIDPLPHQLHVAQKIVSSGNPNWLIADDVGLGKTIEVGLVLHALTQRNRCRRALIVCPAGLVRQWKEEMQSKFERLFEIYGLNFSPDTADELRLRDNIIVSLDLAKRPEHSELILNGGPWDVIVFDEAHRLGRSESGEKTERYRLAEQLRTKSPSMLLLTATPHQGKTRRFAALLELVRPDLKRKIASLSANPEIVGEIIIRNRKTLVTDAKGVPIFRGHDTVRYSVPPSQPMIDFDKALRHYLTKGYGVGAKAGTEGRAVGFVMTTYRKLASSSLAAIERALRLRRERLKSAEPLAPKGGSIESLLDSGELEGNDHLETLEQLYAPKAFFADEEEHLDRLIALAGVAKRSDAKLQVLIQEVMKPLLTAGQHLLVFTEYRGTQSYVADSIRRAFPEVGSVGAINGSMSLDEKTATVRAFNAGEIRVLISTEAGGEGLNLQQSCHVMVNYDLPWNPARLVQRIGRLYLYGQAKRVQVLNLHADDSFDNQALGLMLERVETMARDLAAVESINTEALQADVLGELLSYIDMQDILERAQTLKIELTASEIDQAIESARQARELEHDILQYADGHQGASAGALTAEHMESFVEHMLPMVGGKIRGKSHQGKILEIELPLDLQNLFPEFGRRVVIRATTNRRLAREATDVFHLDFENPLVRHLATVTRNRRSFDGLYASTSASTVDGSVGIFQVRWQDGDGQLLADELVPIACATGGRATRMDEETLAGLLLKPLPSMPTGHCRPIAADTVDGIRAALDGELARATDFRKMPGSVSLFGALHRPDTSPN